MKTLIKKRNRSLHGIHFKLLLFLGILFFNLNLQAQNCCQSNCPSYVTNGDFSGNTGDDYRSFMDLVDTINSPSMAMESYDASGINPAWLSNDHSGNGSKFLLIDGPSKSMGDKVVWRQNVYVETGKIYCFSAFVRNVCVNCSSYGNPGFQLWGQ